MADKVHTDWVAQVEARPTNYCYSRERYSGEKALLRAQANRTFPRLEACMLCGDQATQRHSKSGHKFPVSAEDTLPVCRNCHSVIHHGDMHGASWAWRHPAA